MKRIAALVALGVLLWASAASAATVTLNLNRSYTASRGGPAAVICFEYVADSVAAGDTLRTPHIGIMGAREVVCYVGAKDTTGTIASVYVDSLAGLFYQVSLDGGSNWNTAATAANAALNLGVNNFSAGAFNASLQTSPTASGGYRPAHLFASAVGSNMGTVLMMSTAGVRFAATVTSRPRNPSVTGNAAMYRPIWRVYVIYDTGAGPTLPNKF